MKSKTNWKRRGSSKVTIDRCTSDVKPPLTDCVSFPNMNLEYFRESSMRSLHGLHGEHSLVVQMRCTGYNLFVDTGKPEGALQRIRKALRLRHRTEWLQALWVDKYCIEVDRPDLPGVPEALEDIGSRLYGMAAR